MQRDRQQCSARSQMIFPARWKKYPTKPHHQTWTFDRLTLNGNEGVGAQINYLVCAYRTKYYVVDKVNGKINAIHDDSLELTEFKGHFSPFNLEELEMRST